MKRSAALAPLSRDHHQGLVVAQRLRRADADGLPAARQAFLEFWAAEGRRHFREEEEILLPAFARHGPADHETVARVLCEHVDLRRRAADLAAEPGPGLAEAHELGARFTAHIRHEERVLFPLIEAALPEAELAALVVALT